MAMYVMRVARSEEIGAAGRTDIYYDGARNMAVSISQSTVDYLLQYYYRVRFVSSVSKSGEAVALGSFGFDSGQEGSGSVLIETPAEPGVEYTAMAYYTGVMRYRTYEVIYTRASPARIGMIRSGLSRSLVPVILLIRAPRSVFGSGVLQSWSNGLCTSFLIWDRAEARFAPPARLSISM